jgi:hypothetical protein
MWVRRHGENGDSSRRSPGKSGGLYRNHPRELLPQDETGVNRVDMQIIDAMTAQALDREANCRVEQSRLVKRSPQDASSRWSLLSAATILYLSTRPLQLP